MLDVRRTHFKEKLRAHQAMLEQNAAKSIQSMYWQWTAKQFMKKQRWKLERRHLFQLRVKQAQAAVLIQKIVRSKRKQEIGTAE